MLIKLVVHIDQTYKTDVNVNNLTFQILFLSLYNHVMPSYESLSD